MNERKTRIWDPARWKDFDTMIARVRLGDAIRNHVPHASRRSRMEYRAAIALAERVDLALAQRGLRIDNTACVVGFVERAR